MLMRQVQLKETDLRAATFSKTELLLDPQNPTLISQIKTTLLNGVKVFPRTFFGGLLTEQEMTQREIIFLAETVTNKSLLEQINRGSGVVFSELDGGLSKLGDLSVRVAAYDSEGRSAEFLFSPSLDELIRAGMADKTAGGDGYFLADQISSGSRYRRLTFQIALLDEQSNKLVVLPGLYDGYRSGKISVQIPSPVLVHFRATGKLKIILIGNAADEEGRQYNVEGKITNIRFQFQGSNNGIGESNLIRK